MEFAKKYGMDFVKFDQGQMGHQRRKPTTLMSDLEELRQLHGLRSESMPVEPMHSDLQKRMEQTHTWSQWAPGLVAAIKQAVRNFVMDTARMKKFSLEEWRKHVKQNHIPFRRDCRLCLEEMGQDLPHRRRKKEKGDAAYVMSVDIAGPFTTGWDYGKAREARYALLATIPVPVAEPKGVEGNPEAEAEGTEDGGGPGAEAEGAEDADGLEEFAPDEVELKALQTTGRFEDEILRKQAAEAGEPVEVQNITVMEPLPSRQACEVVKALDKVFAQFRAMGVPALRLHSDRAKELLSTQVEAWAGRNRLVQTMTGGDDPAANGRVEAEVCQWKRRLRLCMKSSQSTIEEWPSVGRHVSEERLRGQLRKLGCKTLPMLPYNERVWVKRKTWHRALVGKAALGSPYFEAKLKGPSPMMSHGWVVQSGEGKVQHARAVLTVDPDSEKAIMELLEDQDEKPRRRIHGKQPPEGAVRVPQPDLLEDPRIRARVEDVEDHPLPPLDAELSSLQHPGAEVQPGCSVSPELAEPGQAYTHIGRSDEERQMKEDHQFSGGTLTWGEFDSMQSSRWAGGEQVEEDRTDFSSTSSSLSTSGRTSQQSLQALSASISLEDGKVRGWKRGGHEELEMEA